ncbi:MAG: acyl-CoA thioesterase II [Sphingomonadales bacterium]|nr:acyl-CoA thioesterase II [Sphingomonadales bacterium]
MSIYPPEQARTLLTLLDLASDGADRFTGARKPGGVGRVFGGQVVAQALVAAQRTVADDRTPHSLHAYFLRGGSEDHAIDYAIERDFDGGSFSNRRVIARQQGTPILNCTVSFHRRETGFAHQFEMPEVPSPEGLESELALRHTHIERAPEPLRALMLRPPLVEFRPCNPDAWMGTPTAPAIMANWFRVPGALPDDPAVHRAVLAYASDYTLLANAALPHPISWMEGTIMSASLDHAVWFHDSDFRADDWLLYATDSPWSGHGRGFNRGRIYTRDGRLVAETAQEGLIRQIKPKP